MLETCNKHADTQNTTSYHSTTQTPTPSTDLQQLYSKNKRLWISLEMVQILVAQRVVRVDLGNAAAVSLAFQGIFTSTDVPQWLGHQWVQGSVLNSEDRRKNSQHSKLSEITTHIASHLASSLTLVSQVNSAISSSLMVIITVSHTASLNFFPKMSSMGLLQPPMVLESSSTVPSHWLVR